jgi:hypothetical protein
MRHAMPNEADALDPLTPTRAFALFNDRVAE